jgi:hypothetical protein
MKNIFAIIIMLMAASTAVAAGDKDERIAKDVPAAKAVAKAAVKAAAKPAGLLRDGFAFPRYGVEGLITKSRIDNKWFFSPYTNISDTRHTILAGMSVELLPSSTLEKIIAEINSDPKHSSTLEIKLWGMVTKYCNVSSSRETLYSDKLSKNNIFHRNFIFPLNFISIISTNESAADAAVEPKADKTEVQEPDDPTSIIPKKARDMSKKPPKIIEEIVLDKSNTGSIIPKEVTKEFKPIRIENLAKWKKKITVEMDTSLTNRIGFITQGDRYKIFNIDAVGLAVDGATFKLLECETLQRTEQSIIEAVGRKRYKVSGTVTKFKGEYYLLLQRSVKTYNHGNFSR